MYSSEFQEIINKRRSNRKFDPLVEVPDEVIKRSLERAILSPNSSNMQLWEFYHVVDKDLLKKLSHLCLDQPATATAKQLVVFVTRRDLFRKRAKANLAFEKGNITRNSPADRQQKRIKDRELYYGKVMPFFYGRFFGLLGLVRKLVVHTIHLFRPIITTVSEADNRVVVHKSCALAVQTFLLAMANEKYDTCAMEGFDSRKVKGILKLPLGAEVNMIISCGIREEHGVWGDRMRVPFDEVYKRV